MGHEARNGIALQTADGADIKGGSKRPTLIFFEGSVFGFDFDVGLDARKLVAPKWPGGNIGGFDFGEVLQIFLGPFNGLVFEFGFDFGGKAESGFGLRMEVKNGTTGDFDVDADDAIVAVLFDDKKIHAGKIDVGEAHVGMDAFGEAVDENAMEGFFVKSASSGGHLCGNWEGVDFQAEEGVVHVD